MGGGGLGGKRERRNKGSEMRGGGEKGRENTVVNLTTTYMSPLPFFLSLLSSLPSLSLFPLSLLPTFTVLPRLVLLVGVSTGTRATPLQLTTYSN